ncbi:MAG: SPOR domain-containing protein [Gammaproteobacteria bacterium]|nr:SPOR domain-containing protein [Gammaproteobacteria bacterium]
MRYLIYLLVIANLAFWAWYPAPPEPMPRDRALSLPPGVETLVLLRERGQDTEPAETDPSPVPEPAPEASQLPADDVPLEGPPPEPEPVAVEQPVDRCYSIGPFMAAEDQAAAATTLRRAGLEVKSRSSDVQEPIGYWVYLPAMASEEARRVAAELTRQGVSDYFIGKQNYISLGAFSAKPAAEERRRQIAALGYEPRLDPRFRTRTAFWLDVLESVAAPVPEERWAEIQARYPEAWRQSLSCE